MKSRIDRIRRQFNDIDKNILLLLGARGQLSRKMAKLKKENKLDIIQEEIWKQHLENRYKENVLMQVDETFLNKFFELIHTESIRIQKNEMKNLK